MLQSSHEKIEQLILSLSEGLGTAVGRRQLADALDVSADTLDCWIEGLRAQGIRIEGRPNEGYCLLQRPDLLLPRLVQARLNTTHFGKTIHHYFQVGSTNDVAHHLAEEGAEEGTVVLAEEQTQGRGRMGRSWVSEKMAGIYSSLILRPKMKPGDAPVLNLAAAVAVSESIEETCRVASDIKWPNDVLLNGRKCCGILTEMTSEGDQIKYVVAGIGLNVNQREFPEALRTLASSLRLEGKRSYSRIEILCSLLEHLEAICRELRLAGSGAIIERWVRRSSYAVGKRVRVNLGDREIRGVTAGLSERGTLKVKLDTGQIEEIMAGDVATWR